jgi:hypothetical protein
MARASTTLPVGFDVRPDRMANDDILAKRPFPSTKSSKLLIYLLT